MQQSSPQNQVEQGTEKKVVRGHEWIQREYGDEKWSMMHDILAEIIRQGETSMPRVMRKALQIMRTDWTLTRPSAVEQAARSSSEGLKQLECVLGGQLLRLPAAVAWEAFDEGSANLLQGFCPPDADAVIELGSGWGRRLADVWLRGTPKSAAYFGCEYTETGVACNTLLGSTEKEFNLTSFQFDYHKPDLSSVAGRFKNVYVFTHSSIEQIPMLKEDVLHEIMGLAPKVTVTHLEPIGWQIKAARGLPVDTISSQKYAEEHDYNRNFWDVLTGLDAKGTLKIGEVVVDILGINPKNADSLVTWSHG